MILVLLWYGLQMYLSYQSLHSHLWAILGSSGLNNFGLSFTLSPSDE